MRIITEEPLKAYIAKYPDTKSALQTWAKTVKEAKWDCFADVKKSFNSVDKVISIMCLIYEETTIGL